MYIRMYTMRVQNLLMQHAYYGLHKKKWQILKSFGSMTDVLFTLLGSTLLSFGVAHSIISIEIFHTV
jgi:hypothetical protein